MKVNEIFYSIQGEGLRAGQATVFIRLTGCDMTCGFCDTEFTSGKEMSPVEILQYVRANYPTAQWLCWTGGEPMLQLTPEIIALFKTEGYMQSIESNGNHPIPRAIDWIVVSPKVAEHVLVKHFPEPGMVDELRYVRHKGQMAPPETKVSANRYYLSPIFDGASATPENINHCIKLCLENPKWQLSIQLHKLLKVL